MYATVRVTDDLIAMHTRQPRRPRRDALNPPSHFGAVRWLDLERR